jgi:hypothetical protein
MAHLMKEKPLCRFCHRELYVFAWNNILTACCNNDNCLLFKQPQNIKTGADYGEAGEREKGSF